MSVYKKILVGSAFFMLIAQSLPAQQVPDENIPAVIYAKVKQIREQDAKRYVGKVESIKHVDLMPRITGELQKIHFAEGSSVKKGDLLFELEDTAYQARVMALEAQLDQLKAEMNYAEKQYNRYKSLMESDAVAVSVFDNAERQYFSVRAQIKTVEANLIDARNNLSYTKIYAPQDGRIGKSTFTEGNLISPANGMKLADIVMIAPIYVKFSISERVYLEDFGGEENIRKKARVKLQLPDGTIHPESASITLVNNKINPETDSITLWAVFANRDQKLLPGGYVTVLLSALQEQALRGVLPSALVAGDGAYAVYVINEKDQLELKNVELGETDGEYQIIKSGLTGNERVIVDGTHKLRPGMKVKAIDSGSLE